MADSLQISTAAPHSEPQDAQVPLFCKDCDREFAVPYRHFQAGVVFHCPHCRGSYVPRVSMYLAMRDAFDKFAVRRDELERSFPETGGGESGARAQAEKSAELYESLRRLARNMVPAGKVVRKKGLRAMFT